MQVAFFELFDQGVFDLQQHFVEPIPEKDHVCQNYGEKEHQTHCGGESDDTFDTLREAGDILLRDIRDEKYATVDRDC